MQAPAFALKQGIAPDRALALAAFAADEVTRSTIEQAADLHWPGSKVLDGGLAAATEYLAQGETPDLLIVDLGTSQDPFTDLMTLADSCDPKTDVIALGTINDLHLYKQFVNAGVADYLVKPFSADELESALLAASLRESADAPTEQAAANLADVTLVIGTRGGVGASLIAANGAWIMAEERDKHVALVDLDVQFGTSALALDLVPAGGLLEALQNPSRVDKLFMASAMVPRTDHLSVLAAEEELSRDTTFQPEALDRLLEEMRPNFDAVWIDMPRAMVRHLSHAFSGVKSILLVSDLSLAGMRDAVRLRAYCQDAAPRAEIKLVLNRVTRTKTDGLTVGQFEKGTESSVDFQVPEDEKTTATSAATGKSLSQVAKRAKITASVRTIANSLLAEPAADRKLSFLNLGNITNLARKSKAKAA